MSGEVTVDGEPMTTRSVQAKSAIGYLPQDLTIYPDLSGRENLMFSPVMRRVAHITPQAWGNDAFVRLVGHGASITGILPQLGVLAAYAAVLLTLAAWRLRRVLAG